MKKIVLTGASGFVANALKKDLPDIYEFIDLTRDDYKDKALLAEKLEGVDAVFNLAGANISQKWTPSHKKAIYDSRINTTRALVEAFSLVRVKPKMFISTSAVGRYKEGESHDEKSTSFSEGYLGKVTQDWEDEALKAENYGIKTLIFRFGVVLGKGGGMLSKILIPFKLGVGGVIGDGQFDFSWIHIDDLVGAYRFALENNLGDGVYNITAPQPVTNEEFTFSLGEALHRPTVFPVPIFMLKLMFGEGAQVMSSGQRVYPKALLENNFNFKHPTIDEALKDIVN